MMNVEDNRGIELFRKFSNAFAGQGESERLNKRISMLREADQNKQQAETTSAYAEIHSYYTNIDRAERREKRKVVGSDGTSYLMHVKDYIVRKEEKQLQAQKDAEELLAFAQLPQEAGAEQVVDEALGLDDPIDEDDADYANGDAEDPLEAAIIQHSNGMRIRLLPPAAAGAE
jgi:hypothetical protein